MKKKYFWKRDLLVLFSFISVFSTTFSGDYRVFDIVPAFYIAWTFSIFLRFLYSVRYTRVEAIAQSLIISFLFPVFFQEALSANFYSNGFVFSLLYVNILLIFPLLLYNVRLLFYICVSCLLAFSLVSIYSILSGNVRTHAIFGPNVLYRIYVFLFALCVISIFMLKEKKGVLNSPALLVAFFLFLICIIGTGSRGGAVAAIFLSLLIFYNGKLFFGVKKVNTKKLVLSSFVAGLMYYIYIFHWESVWRLVYFDIDNNSEATRLNFVASSIDYFLSYNSFKSFLFGDGSSVFVLEFGFYPHNLILESLIYGGLFFLIASLVSYFSISFAFFQNINKFWLAFPVSGVVVGSLFSGDLLTNYPVISIGFLFFVYKMYSSSEKFSLHPRK